MKLGEAMALGIHFVNSKHDQNVAVSMNIIMTGSLPLTIMRRALSAFQHIFVCAMIRSHNNTSNSEKKDQNSIYALH